MDPIRLSYYNAVDPKPAWPMTARRVDAIYGTMRRTIRGADDSGKQAVRDELVVLCGELEHVARESAGSQQEFDRWWSSAVGRLGQVPINWCDARGVTRRGLTFGLSQKFLNLCQKDWWCVGASATDDCSVLHAPFDNRVWQSLWRLQRFEMPSLAAGGYYVHLGPVDYRRYQEQLLRKDLHALLGASGPLIRMEVDQLLWSVPA